MYTLTIPQLYQHKILSLTFRKYYFIFSGMNSLEAAIVESEKRNLGVPLSNQQRNYIILELAQFTRQKDIIIGLDIHYDRPGVTPETITRTEKAHKATVKQLRDQWINNISSEAGSHKRVRIRVLWKLVTGLQDGIDDISKRADLKKNDPMGVERLLASQSKTIDQIINSIRLEMEGSRISVYHHDLNSENDRNLLDIARGVFEQVDPNAIDNAEFKDIKP